MVTRDRGSSGQQLDSKTFDPSAVQPGKTTREEVLAKFSMVNTGYNDPHFFWGRWATSKWGYWWIVIAPAYNGGGAAGAGDAHRIWQIHNILITFDDNGLVTNKELLDDGPPLWGELNHYVAALPAVDGAEAISIPGDTLIELKGDWLEAVRTRHRKSSRIRITADKIVRIAHAGPSDKRNCPGLSCHILYLKEKTAFGRKLRFCADGPDLIGTLRYLHRYALPNMQWE